MSRASRIQQQAIEIEWRRWADEDTYYPLRDDARAERQNGRPRQYQVRWAVECRSVAKALSEPQIAIAGHVRNLFVRTHPPEMTRFEFVDGNGGGNSAERKRLRRLNEKHELAGFEAVARQIPGGHQCFHAIIEGDDLSALSRRCGFHPRDQRRQAISLIIDTLRALELYHGFNQIDAARDNARVG